MGLLQDNCLGLAVEFAYFFFLALFPALLFFVALASFFPVDRLADHVLSFRFPRTTTAGC